jgi:hypothetical protein
MKFTVTSQASLVYVVKRCSHLTYGALMVLMTCVRLHVHLHSNISEGRKSYLEFKFVRFGQSPRRHSGIMFQLFFPG